MKKLSEKYLILGGTGSFGYAFTREVLDQGKEATLLVRSRSKAEKLFGKHPGLHLIEGDAFDAAVLQQAAEGQDFILHALNVPYQNWYTQMMPLTAAVIDVAKKQGSTLLFPANIYNYGLNTTGITEDSPEKPITKKGQFRQKIENRLKEATDGGLRVIMLRLPDFWGPNVAHKGMAPLFEGALAGKKMPWMVNNQIPHQLVYNKDAAKVMFRLSQDASLPVFTHLVFGGHIVRSMADFCAQLAQRAGTSAKASVTPKGVLNMLALFIPIVKELKEMFYLYENNVYLDDSRIKKMYPDLSLTPLPVAMDETLAWFRER